MFEEEFVLTSEFRGFALLFVTVVMVGTIYIFFNGEDENAYSDKLYTKEVHNEIMAVERDANTPDEIDGLMEDAMLTDGDHEEDLKSVTMVE